MKSGFVFKGLVIDRTDDEGTTRSIHVPFDPDRFKPHSKKNAFTILLSMGALCHDHMGHPISKCEIPNDVCMNFDFSFDFNEDTQEHTPVQMSFNTHQDDNQRLCRIVSRIISSITDIRLIGYTKTLAFNSPFNA